MMIETHAYARAGLLGNPSDGYFGKTISIIIRNFGAHVTLYESPELRLEPHDEDRNIYQCIHDLSERVSATGYYGGRRLIKAAINVFCQYCTEQKISLHEKHFTIRYQTSIPRQVGLAGSSAIVTATFRALMQFYDVEIPQELLPTLILKAETEELGINAGLQDRVIQVYEGCVFMDFDKRQVESKGFGRYEPLDPQQLPKLYLAYKTSLSKVSGKVLNTIRVQYDQGDAEVIGTLNEIAGLAETGKQALTDGNPDDLHAMIDRNFDLRCKIMDISENNLEMVRTARECGASAKFAGSGGCIIGTYRDDDMLRQLQHHLKKLDARVIRPTIL